MEEELRKIFVGKIQNLSESQLEIYFKKFGKVHQIYVLRKRPFWVNYGFAFVTTSKSVADNIIKIRDHFINGVTVRTAHLLKNPFMGKEITSGQDVYRVIHIGELDNKLTHDHVYNVFSEFGEISFFQMQMDATGNRNRGFCALNFRDPEINEQVLSMSRNFKIGDSFPRIGPRYSSSKIDLYLHQNLLDHNTQTLGTESSLLKSKNIYSSTVSNSFKCHETKGLSRIRKVPLLIYNERQTLGTFFNLRSPRLFDILLENDEIRFLSSVYRRTYDKRTLRFKQNYTFDASVIHDFARYMDTLKQKKNLGLKQRMSKFNEYTNIDKVSIDR